jgi:hypothetical protein
LIDIKEIKSYDYTHTTDFDFKALCELLAKEHHDLAIEKIKVLAREVKVKSTVETPIFLLYKQAQVRLVHP